MAAPEQEASRDRGASPDLGEARPPRPPRGGPDARPFFARVLGGGPGSPPVIEVGIELCPGQPGGNVPTMRLRIPYRQAVRLQAQLGAAIGNAQAWGRVPPGEPERSDEA
ncbi:MAG: hypothetical protein PGN25_05620 [Methylorubrum populi]